MHIFSGTILHVFSGSVLHIFSGTILFAHVFFWEGDYFICTSYSCSSTLTHVPELMSNSRVGMSPVYTPINNGLSYLS